MKALNSTLIGSRWILNFIQVGSADGCLTPFSHLLGRIYFLAVLAFIVFFAFIAFVSFMAFIAFMAFMAFFPSGSTGIFFISTFGWIFRPWICWPLFSKSLVQISVTSSPSHLKCWSLSGFGMAIGPGNTCCSKFELRHL